MDFTKLQLFLSDKKEPSYRFAQIVGEVASGRAGDYEQIFTIPRQLRQDLNQNIPIISVTCEQVLNSKTKKAHKALLKLTDGNLIETVLLNSAPSLWSVCLSCQVGCAMGCQFCATGSQGLTRNLTAEEITDQILFWRQYIFQNKLKIRISNIVYMGMGEPLLNTDSVFQSLNWLIDPILYGVGQRHISISSCGIIPQIADFAQKFPQINLAISLHAPDDQLRSQLMPVNRQYPLTQLMLVLQNYLKQSNRQLFFEYVMLKDVNDTDDHAIKLGNLLKDYFADMIQLIHVNLIPYNTTNDKFCGSSEIRIKHFERILKQQHIGTTIRKSLGQDIKGACGQLRGKVKN